MKEEKRLLLILQTQLTSMELNEWPSKGSAIIQILSGAWNLPAMWPFEQASPTHCSLTSITFCNWDYQLLKGEMCSVNLNRTLSLRHQLHNCSKTFFLTYGTDVLASLFSTPLSTFIDFSSFLTQVSMTSSQRESSRCFQLDSLNSLKKWLGPYGLRWLVPSVILGGACQQ